MTTEKTTDSGNTPARIISMVFHPLFIPIYGLAIIFSAPTLFGYLPFAVKKILFLILLINNVILPLSLMPYFKYRNIISSWNVESRKERIIPLFTTSLFFSITSFIVFRFQIPLFLKSFIFATTCMAISIFLINFWWKISIHAVGTGALTAIVVILSLRMYTPLTLYLISVIIVSGLVLSSRLKLNIHNPPQVWAGYLTGLIGTFLIILLF